MISSTLVFLHGERLGEKEKNMTMRRRKEKDKLEQQCYECTDVESWVEKE